MSVLRLGDHVKGDFYFDANEIIAINITPKNIDGVSHLLIYTRSDEDNPFDILVNNVSASLFADRWCDLKSVQP